MLRKTRLMFIVSIVFLMSAHSLAQTVWEGEFVIPAIYCYYCDLGNCTNDQLYNSGTALRNLQHSWIQIMNNSEVDLLGETDNPDGANYVRLYLYGADGEPIYVDLSDCDPYFENAVKSSQGIYVDVTQYFPSVLNQTTYPPNTPTPTPTPGYPRFQKGQTASFYLPCCLNSINDRSLSGYNPPAYAKLKIRRTFNTKPEEPTDGAIEVLLDAGWELLYDQTIIVPAFTPIPPGAGTPTPTPINTVTVNHSGQDAGSLLNRAEFNITQ